jgi:sugar/nucleoside kinase (ribokinase family)
MSRIQPLKSRVGSAPVIVAVGQTTIDTVLIDGQAPSLYVGGSAYIPSRIWAGSGTRVGLVSCLGQELKRLELSAENLDLRGVVTVPGPSTSVELHYSNQNLIALRVVPGASEKFVVSQVPADYFEAKLFYISPAPIGFLLELTELAHARKIAIAFSPKEDFPPLAQAEMKQLFSRCKFCFFNERELGLVTKISSVRNAISAVHDSGVEIVVVTKGKRGVTISSRESGSFDMAPSKVVVTDNPIGAGDCFAAIFLAGSISQLSIRDSTERAITYTERWLMNRKQSSEWRQDANE